MSFKIFIVLYGTRGGTRTPTSVKILDPKSSASTNSATLANHKIVCNDFQKFEKIKLHFYTHIVQ